MTLFCVIVVAVNIFVANSYSFLTTSRLQDGNSKYRITQPGTSYKRKEIFTFSAERDKPDKNRKIVGRDNLGEPIYEGDLGFSGGGNSLDILGVKVPIDPFTASLLVFLVIAFQFFVVANM